MVKNQFLQLRQKWENSSPFAGDGHFLPSTTKRMHIDNFPRLGNNIKFENLTFLTMLGEGAFGKVFQGKHSDSNVAIKTVSIGRSNIQTIEKEVSALNKISHENIVSVKGCCFHNQDVNLVKELVDGINLENLLQNAFFKKQFV